MGIFVTVCFGRGVGVTFLQSRYLLRSLLELVVGLVEPSLELRLAASSIFLQLPNLLGMSRLGGLLSCGMTGFGGRLIILQLSRYNVKCFYSLLGL